ARLDGARQLVAQLLELLEALLEVGALHRELLEPDLLRLVLLLRQRVDLAELLAPLLVALEPVGELVAILALRRLLAGCLEPPLRLVALRVGARQLDVDRREALTGLGGLLAQLDLLRAEPTQGGAELARPRR